MDPAVTRQNFFKMPLNDVTSLSSTERFTKAKELKTSFLSFVFLSDFNRLLVE